MFTDTIFPYSPDNAALLYYQAFLMIERIDDTMLKTLADLSAGRIKLNEEIKEHIKRCRDVIDLIVVAAKMPNCDWGLDYSKGAKHVQQENHPYVKHLLQMCNRRVLLPISSFRAIESSGYSFSSFGISL